MNKEYYIYTNFDKGGFPYPIMFEGNKQEVLDLLSLMYNRSVSDTYLSEATEEQVKAYKMLNFTPIDAYFYLQFKW